jgi:hypothetical protein
MMKRLATIAALVVATWSFSANATALTINDPGVVGTVQDAVPFSDANAQTYINNLLSLGANSGPTSIGTETYTTSSTDYNGTVGTVAGSGDCTTNPSGCTSVGSGYDYIIAKYDGPNAGAVVYYLGGASMTLPSDSSTIWLNTQSQGYGLSGWKGFNTVPDGGSTATLLGSVLLAFGLMRRRFTSK